MFERFGITRAHSHLDRKFKLVNVDLKPTWKLE